MAPATIDLKKSANLSAFKNALAKAPKNALEKSILEAAQRDGSVAKMFWDAFVASGSGKDARYDTCRHCMQGFDATTNDHDSCAWHYGNLIIDEGSWIDYYETDRGPIDSKENRKEHPGRFFWDCCGLQLPAAGCLRTMHAPRVVLTRNGRVLEDLEIERTKARRNDEIDDREPGPQPAKKRKVAAGAQTTCRMCGTLYDESNNTARVCHWHDLDGVRRFTGEQEGRDSDEDQCYSENEYGGDEDSEEEGGKIQWTCCGHDKKEGGGCVVTTHLPPRCASRKKGSARRV